MLNLAFIPLGSDFIDISALFEIERRIVAVHALTFYSIAVPGCIRPALDRDRIRIVLKSKLYVVSGHIDGIQAIFTEQRMRVVHDHSSHRSIPVGIHPVTACCQ